MNKKKMFLFKIFTELCNAKLTAEYVNKQKDDLVFNFELSLKCI